ncbi:hypothetical protein [Microbacterium sp. AG238]|uniref:hypothetical protein n=1 Tax=Microbacterium sp. AG238 TaxID=2183994 RepID=UPI000FF6E88C|nr:hypothetical protein [Microbacterium sp. AG238]RKE60478.1 hypothetical protein DEU36_2921 [Microbacterium sp. AG238]
MRSPLEPDTRLDVELSAICARNQYTRDPEPVIAELAAAAHGRDDILTRAAGLWAGYFDSPETHVLAMALSSIPGTNRWVEEGLRRRGVAQQS